VIGETAVVGDNVSMLHHVSLGGSGTGKGECGFSGAGVRELPHSFDLDKS